MNIYFRLFSQVASSCIEKLPSLTQQQKKIIRISLIAFTCLTACYLIIKRCCFKAKPLKMDNPDPFVPPNVIPIDPIAKPFHPVLPVEILTYIFEIVLEDAFVNGREKSFFPNQVCRQWRQAYEKTFVRRLRNNQFSSHMSSLSLADMVH